MRAVLAAADPVGQRNTGNVFKGAGGVDATRIDAVARLSPTPAHAC